MCVLAAKIDQREQFSWQLSPKVVDIQRAASLTIAKRYSSPARA